MKTLILASLYLLSIAQQCPFEGGNAVFKARALYALIDNDIAYDNDALCGNQALKGTANNGVESESKTIATKTPSGFHLYPNPAKDILTLEYSLAKEGHLIVFDIYGREVMKKILSPANHHIRLRTQDIANGLYILKIFDTDSEHFFSKIIIQH